MAAFMQAPRQGVPQSKEELKKLMGRGRMYDFLTPQLRPDYQVFFDDFNGDTINLDNWALANSGGTGAVNFAKQVGRGGWVRGESGTTDDGSISMIGPLEWYGDANVYAECRVKIDAITGLDFEFGLIDAVPSSNGAGVTDEDTPTAAFADGAVISIDTDETYQKLGYYTKGSTANQGIKRTSASGSYAHPLNGASVTSGVPDAAEWVTYGIALRGDYSYTFWINGNAIAHAAPASAGHIEGGIALALWFYCRTRNTTTKTPDIDYAYAIQERGA